MSHPLHTVRCPECGATMRRRTRGDGGFYLRCEWNACPGVLAAPRPVEARLYQRCRGSSLDYQALAAQSGFSVQNTFGVYA
jgi:hypothetical protein